MTGYSAEVSEQASETGERWRPATVTVSGGNPAGWVESNVELVRDLLHEHGAVRLRGSVVDAESFSEAVAAAAGAPLGDYVQRSTPRTLVEGKVYTSTEYRADQVIPMHSEQSYAHFWPKVVGFWCKQPAASGGETPLASTADVLENLPDELVARFDEHGVCYERWYQPFLDLPWQDAFQTDDPAEVDRFCAASGTEAEWHDGNVLRTRQISQATLLHAPSGRRVWFNQAGVFHPSALPPAVEQALRARAGDRLPRNVLFGDGRPIPAEDIATILASVEHVTWREPWELDDIVIVDNEAVAHGRGSYTGARSVLVAMAGEGTIGVERAGNGDGES
jgi:hypothetical protein